MIQPIGPYLVVRLIERTASKSPVWTPEQESFAQAVEVLKVGRCEERFGIGERILVSWRQATMVGTEYLVPEQAVLARLR